MSFFVVLSFRLNQCKQAFHLYLVCKKRKQPQDLDTGMYTSQSWVLSDDFEPVSLRSIEDIWDYI